MEFAEYQKATRATDQRTGAELEDVAVHLLGLVGEAGSVAAEYKKKLGEDPEEFAVMGYDRQGRSLRLARFLDRGLVPCGSAGSGLSDADVRQVRAALDAKHAVIVTVEYRGFTPAGELRHPVVRAWHRR